MRTQCRVRKVGDFLKRTEIEPTLERLFERPPFTIAKTYKICWYHGGLTILSASTPIQPEIVFLIVHKSEFKTGLTSRQWEALVTKIVSFMTQKGYL